MLLPVGDAPNENPSKPWVNYGLIAINFAVYFWAILTYPGDAAYQAWVHKWGFTPVDPRISTFFSSMFMHGGFMHVGGNMLFLWIFGDNVEGRLGHLGYLFAYLASGLAAVLVFLALDPGSTVPLVGASGAIFGIEGLYFVMFPQNRVRIFYWFFIIGWAWVKARWILGLYFLLNLFYVLSAQGQTTGGGVAYAAHVGGFLYGFALAWAVRALSPKGELVPGLRAVVPGPISDLLAHARRALSAGDVGGAEAFLRRALHEHLHDPEAPEAALQLGLLYSRVLGRPEAARSPLSFAARLHPDARARSRAAHELQRIM